MTWKTRSPDDDAGLSWFPPICEECGANYDEDDGPMWGREWREDWTAPVIVPFGWCSKCGWRSEACPDIEDLYERIGE